MQPNNNIRIPVTVYAESTPNPAAMKFVCSMMLLHEGSVEYFSPEEATASPLAASLFRFSGIKAVFITSNFITVQKDSETDWYEIVNIIREFIRGHLMEGGKVFISNPFTNGPKSSSVETITADSPAQASAQDDSELNEKIRGLLEEYVKPAVEQDGGAIEFRSFSEGVVTVALKGSCSGCPSSTMTLKSGIENLLKGMLPEVREVVAESE